MKFWAVCFLLSVAWVHANESPQVAEKEEHVQAPIEAPAIVPLTPICLDLDSSEYHAPLCEHFCSREGTRFNTDTNMQIKYLVRRTLTYKGIEDYYLDLFTGSRKTPPPSRNELALLIDRKNSQVNARLQAHQESLVALQVEKPKYPPQIKAKTEKIDQLDTLAKTPHYEDDGTLIRSGLNSKQMKERTTLLNERGKLIKEQRDNRWAIERTQTLIAVIRDQQSIVGANPTEWNSNAEIKNAFTLQTQHGAVVFEFSDDTSNPEPERIWLQGAGQTRKLLCDASDQYVMSERQYRASPPSLGIEHFKDWKNSLQKKMDEEVEVAESIDEVAELHQKELNAATTLKGADEVCAWIATRKPQSTLDLRQLQMEYLKSIYNTLSSQKSTLKQKLETPRDLELEALYKVINTPIATGNWDALEDTHDTKPAERKSKRPHSRSLKPTVQKTKKTVKEEPYQPYVPSYENDSGPSSTQLYQQVPSSQMGSQNQYSGYPIGGMVLPGGGGGYPGYGGGGGFFGGVNGGMTFDMKTSGDVAGILGKASEIFDYCVQQSFLDPENKLAVDRSYDLGRSNFIYQAASFFSSPYAQLDNTQLFYSLQPHNSLGDMAPLYQQQSPYNNVGSGFSNGAGGVFNFGTSW